MDTTLGSQDPNVSWPLESRSRHLDTSVTSAQTLYLTSTCGLPPRVRKGKLRIKGYPYTAFPNPAFAIFLSAVSLKGQLVDCPSSAHKELPPSYRHMAWPFIHSPLPKSARYSPVFSFPF